VAPKKVIYFTDVPDSASAINPYVVSNVTKYEDPVILPNDILNIVIQTSAQNESNSPISAMTTSMFNPLNGFLVDKNGNVELSLIGFVKVGGLTTAEARELIKNKAKEFYKDPVVNCRIANFDIVVIGDVFGPGTYTFPSEKVSILEAISAAHDLSLTGKKSNVLLIRTEGEQKKIVRLNLNSTEIFHSPYLYLRQRDVIYVEPSKYKIRASDLTFTRNLGIVSSMLSLVTLVLAFRNLK
jgi:polysaccharide export outer membrane protein